MRNYNQNKHHRCARNYSVAYTYLKSGEVVLSVCQFGIDNLVPNTEGDGQIFRSIDIAREFAFEKGYIVEYDHREDLEVSIALKMMIDQKAHNEYSTTGV